MPGPFPGFDPFIESQLWRDFRVTFLVTLRENLARTLSPQYFGLIEEREYPEWEDGQSYTERDRFIEIRSAYDRLAVSVIEVPTPMNKRPGSRGRTEYLERCQAWRDAGLSLVEIDVWRGGVPLPRSSTPTAGRGCIVIHDATRASANETWPIYLKSALPRVRIPVEHADEPLQIDLQEVFAELCDRAGYDRALDYSREIQPPLEPDDAAWAAQILTTRL